MPRPEIVQPTDKDYRFIPLTRGQVAIVDASDYEWLNQWNWCALERKSSVGKFYALRRDGNKIVLMHVFITGETGRDHKNGNGLDNRRSNLRKATPSQNMHNTDKPSTNTSGYKGVWLHSPGKWRSRIEIEGKRINSPLFSTPEAAAEFYISLSRQAMGEFSRV